MSNVAQSETDFRVSQYYCDRCGKSIGAGWTFEFRPDRRRTSSHSKQPAGPVIKCFPCAFQHLPMLKRSLMAALVVGTILTLLNQGDLLVSGRWDNTMYWKIPLTYCVPFLVATYGALSNSRK